MQLTQELEASPHTKFRNLLYCGYLKECPCHQDAGNTELFKIKGHNADVEPAQTRLTNISCAVLRPQG